MAATVLRGFLAATDLWVLYVPLVISAFTFVFYASDMWRRSRSGYIATLERHQREHDQKIADLERRLDDCEKDRRGLHEDNYRLMERILRLENGHASRPPS